MLSRSTSRKIWKTALLPLIDFTALLLGSGLVYLIRYRWDDLLGFNFGNKLITGLEYLKGSIFLGLLVVVIYALIGLYEVNSRRSIAKLVLQLGFGIFLVLSMVISYFFFNEYDRSTLPAGVPVSRFILAVGGFLALYFVVIGRFLFWLFEIILYKFGIGKIDIVVIGDKQAYLYNYLNRRSEVNRVYSYKDLNNQDYEFLERLIKIGNVSEIYLFSQDNKLESKLALLSERSKVSFIFAPNGFLQYQAFDLKAVNIGGKVFLELKHTKLDGWQVVLKRLFDITISILFILIFSWLYLLIAIIIKLDSPGSVFYINERVGPNGKAFKLWKFRRFKQEFCTSTDNTSAIEYEKELIKEKDIRGDALYKIADDPRMTRVGKFIEKYSLDELPQFFNVITGNMSIVGPRPHQPREVAKYASHHFKVLNIKPGITGLAQINGRSDLSFEQEVAFDTFYVEHWNFFMDLRIFIQTPIVIFSKKHKA
jgi:exopolysaccharide biosynthesis polyprenyl glycosylphosphotransferase